MYEIVYLFQILVMHVKMLGCVCLLVVVLFACSAEGQGLCKCNFRVNSHKLRVTVNDCQVA